jgi:hypothetical protein
MKRAKKIRVPLIIIVILLFALTACSYPPNDADISDDEEDTIIFSEDLPRALLTGVVVDAEITEFGIMNFFEYEEALTAEIKYSGAKVAIYQAVEAGTTKMGEGFPELINYNKGNKVAELLTDDNGIFLIELPPGVYFVAVFYSVSSYSGDLVIELDENGEQIGIGLIHGI